MSSLRPAKIVAALFHLIGGSLAEPAAPEGPSCSCDRCWDAWRRYQSPDVAATPEPVFAIARRQVS
jgi:hypothetical protein